MANNITHKNGTRASLTALATANGLVPWQIYMLSNEGGRICVANSASTFSEFKTTAQLTQEWQANMNTWANGLPTVEPQASGAWWLNNGVLARKP